VARDVLRVALDFTEYEGGVLGGHHLDHLLGHEIGVGAGYHVEHVAGDLPHQSLLLTIVGHFQRVLHEPATVFVERQLDDPAP